LYKGDIKTYKVIYKIIDIGGMLPLFEIVKFNYTEAYSPIEIWLSK